MEKLLQGLRAAAEPTRLRIIALCGHAELSVNELTAILGQSQPRVSRHLKLLVDGGMVQNSKFCQMLADTLNKEINQPDNVESTALGACKVAMIGSKIDIFSLKNTEGKSFKPIEENIEALSKRYGDWKSFVLNILKFN